MHARQQGFTMLAVLAALVLLALSLQGVMWVVSTQAQRERELELLRVGAAIRDAIGRYVESSPGVVKQWPPSLEALLDDRRSVVLRRHLRRLYADPIQRSGEWGLVRAPDGGVAGVYSLSHAPSIRTSGVDLAVYGVEPAARYVDWRFVYVPPSKALEAPQ
jgi:type II secretory pathway pseudopilin PulG